MALIKWLLFLLIIARTEGLKKEDHSAEEGIMKTILESCYTKNSFPNPVVIFGDFNKFIDGVLTIRINDILNVTNYKEHESLQFKASRVVLMEEKFISHLKMLRKTQLWDNTVPFFIIGKNTAPCTNPRNILRAMWRMEILDSIYICPQSTHNKTIIYTLNPITNYAPYPWMRIDEQRNLIVFRQSFDTNISCTHLTYDKTGFLNGYNSLAGDWNNLGSGWVPGRDYSRKYARWPFIACRAMRTMIIPSNVSGTIEVEIGYDAIVKRYFRGSVDHILLPYSLYSLPKSPYLFPFYKNEMIAVEKLTAEVSTLAKIRHLWSTPVLIAAGFTLTILFLILMIKRWNFGLALSDVTRLLTYTPIQTDNRYQSFRISQRVD